MQRRLLSGKIPGRFSDFRFLRMPVEIPAPVADNFCGKFELELLSKGPGFPASPDRFAG